MARRHAPYILPMVLRSLITLLLLAGLVFPKAGWIMAGWVVGAQTVVICAGSKLVTITLDADGAPIDNASHRQQDCALGESFALVSPPVWARAQPDVSAPAAHPAPAGILSAKPPYPAAPPRAPPARLSPV